MEHAPGEPENQQPDRKMGKTMLIAGWLIFLALLVQIFGDWEESKTNPNRELQSSSIDGIAEVILQRNSQGHYLLNARVNGTTISFLVDTGASQLVFTESQAKKAGLVAGRPYSVSTANGNIRVFSTEVSHLQMADIELHQIPAAINPHMQGYALLGMSALVNLEWSQRGDQLIIRQY